MKEIGETELAIVRGEYGNCFVFKENVCRLMGMNKSREHLAWKGENVTTESVHLL